jgi:hypothetical protein
VKSYDPNAPLVSLHVPKCGGNSVMLLLRELFRDKLELHYHDDRTATPPLRHALGAGSCVHGHFDNRRQEGVDDYYPEVQQFVTLLRDPFDLQVSNYFYMKRLQRRGELVLDGAPASLETSIRAYLERRIEEPLTAPNPLDFLPRALAGDDWETALDRTFVYVGIVEDLRTAAVVLADRLGMAPRWLGHANAGERDEQIPTELRDALFRAHPRQFALYDRARRDYLDRRAFRKPIAKSRLETEELEYRCQLCGDYPACAARGRPPDCDGGSRFHASPPAATSDLRAWLVWSAEDESLAAAATTLMTAHAAGGFWLEPVIAWNEEGSASRRVIFGWPERAVPAADLLTLVPTVADPLADRCRTLPGIGSGAFGTLYLSTAWPPSSSEPPRLLVRLDPRDETRRDRCLAELGVREALATLHGTHGAPILIELAADDTPVLIHLSTRQLPPGAPIALAGLRPTSAVFAVTGTGARCVATDLSLLSAAVDWQELSGILAASPFAFDLTLHNRIKARFHVIESALTVSLEPSQPTLLHQRLVRSLHH